MFESQRAYPLGWPARRACALNPDAPPQGAIGLREGGTAMKPFQTLSHGDDRVVTLQLSGIAMAELLDFLKYVGDHFTECAEHDMRRENLDLAAIAARHWL